MIESNESMKTAIEYRDLWIRVWNRKAAELVESSEVKRTSFGFVRSKSTGGGRPRWRQRMKVNPIRLPLIDNGPRRRRNRQPMLGFRQSHSWKDPSWLILENGSFEVMPRNYAESPLESSSRGKPRWQLNHTLLSISRDGRGTIFTALTLPTLFRCSFSNLSFGTLVHGLLCMIALGVDMDRGVQKAEAPVKFYECTSDHLLSTLNLLPVDDTIPGNIFPGTVQQVLPHTGHGQGHAPG
ncbi:hypothetical protein AKJ16_DCAP18621 [Drosera capensis]